MKKFIIILSALAVLFSSCKKEPSISFLPSNLINVSAEGENVQVKILSPLSWKAEIPAGSPITVTPSSGEGDANISIVVPKNIQSAALSYKITFTSTYESAVATEVLEIVQYPGMASIIMLIEQSPVITGNKCSFKGTISASEDWTAASDITTDVITPSSGTYGDTEITISFEMNKTNEAIVHNLSFTSNTGSAFDETGIPQPAITSITYSDVEYNVRWMKDGKLWMCENLRYVPEGKSVSEDLTAISNGVWYPVTLTSDGAYAFNKENTADGLLYTAETAFNIAAGTLTAENFKSYEGTQGICPEGWHIPTLSDIMNLVGKCASQDDIQDAPYYYKDGGTSSIDLLKADGFTVAAAGMISVANTSATKGTIAGAVGTPKVMNTGYFLGSTGYKEFLNTDNTLKNLQYYSFMVNMKGGTLNGAYSGYKFGANVRCVMDSEE